MRALLTLCCSLPLLMLCAGCDVSRVDVINGTRRPARDVAVSDGRNVWRLGDIPPGGKAKFSGRLEGEGGVRISWSLEGRRFTDDSCYFTGGYAARGSVTIEGNRLDQACR